MNIELEVTTNCNLKCFNCDRQCRQLPSKQIMPLAMISKLIMQANALGVTFDTLSLCGGEPLLYPYLRQAIAMVRPICKRLRIVTNGTIPFKAEDYGLRDGDSMENTHKHDVHQDFDPINMAPVDFLGELDPREYHKGCWVEQGRGDGCGFGYSPRGNYFVRGCGGGIDRVFRLGIGRSELSAMLDLDKNHAQMEVLCRLCGRFLSTHYGYPRFNFECYSPTWAKALREGRKSSETDSLPADRSKISFPVFA